MQKLKTCYVIYKYLIRIVAMKHSSLHHRECQIQRPTLKVAKHWKTNYLMKYVLDPHVKLG